MTEIVAAIAKKDGPYKSRLLGNVYRLPVVDVAAMFALKITMPEPPLRPLVVPEMPACQPEPPPPPPVFAAPEEP